MSSDWGYSDAHWPQLREKEIVDLVNGIEIAGEIVRVKKSRQGFVNNALARLSGREGRERDAIEENVVEGQLALTRWLHAVQCSQIQSDLAIELVARKVASTRRQMVDLSSAINDRLASLESIIAIERARHDDLSDGTFAGAYLDAVLLDARQSALPPLALAFSVADRLWWSDFGAFVRRPGSQTKLARQLSEIAIQSLGDVISSRLEVGLHSPIDMEALAETQRTIVEPDAATIQYLAAGGDVLTAPIHHLIAGERSGGAWPISLPRQTSPGRIAARMMHESQWVARARVDDER